MKVNFDRIIIPSSRNDMVDLLSKFIQCKICMNLLNDPYDCLCCNQTFCKSCILNYIKTNNKCPFSEFFDFNKQKENIQTKKSDINNLLNNIKPSSSNFEKLIHSLKFCCKNNEKGCKIELGIEEILEHEKICKFKGKKTIINLNKKNKNRRNSVFKDREGYNNIKNNKENIKLDKYFDSQNSNKDIFKDNFSNQMKNQDSVVSFSGMKTFFENKNITEFNLNENENNANILSNLKLEKSIEEINQKLSYINHFIINNYNNKLHYEDKHIENEIIDFNKNFNFNNNNYSAKMSKRNSLTITNNYYDSSYINTVNNFANDDKNKINDFNKNITNSNKIQTYKPKEKNFRNYIKEKKNKILYKTLNNKTNTFNDLLNEKENSEKFNNPNKNISKRNKKSNSNNIDRKEIESLEKKNNEEDIENKSKKFNILKNKIINNKTIDTPKLGSKTQKQLKDIKYLNLNLNSNEDNDYLCGKNEEHTPKNLNEDIFLGIKNLNNKMTGIERLLQSNNSFKNQTYSIENDNLFEDIQINQNKNDENDKKGEIPIKDLTKEFQSLQNNKTQIKNIIDNNNKENEIKSKKEEKEDKDDIKDDLNISKKKEDERKCVDEKIYKKIEELLIEIEKNIKSLLNEKFEENKKYIEENFIEEIKKNIIETNFDIMNLNKERLDEFEKIIKEKLK